MRLQTSWMNGDFDEVKQYPYKEYGEMILDVRKFRKDYQHAKTYDDRKEIAKEEFQRWVKYLEIRKERIRDNPELSIDNWIPTKSYKLLKESFDREKHRDTNRVMSDKIVEMHSRISKVYQFVVPIHPRNLS